MGRLIVALKERVDQCGVGVSGTSASTWWKSVLASRSAGEMLLGPQNENENENENEEESGKEKRKTQQRKW